MRYIVRPLHKAIIGMVVGLTIAGAAVADVLSRTVEEPLPAYGAAPEFSLVDQEGRSLRSTDLKGKVVLAAFIFTNCPDFCPLLSAKMSQAQDLLKARGWFGEKVLLVSFSVDPERDTPPVLKAYGEKFRADALGWRWATGEPEQVRRVVVDGFHLPLNTTTTPVSGGDSPGRGRDGPTIDIAHTDRMVLIDTAGQVRGYLSGGSVRPEEMIQEIAKLVR